MKKALTIAGSDSSGGAGIQADIKTMTMNGVFAMSAVTALTAQNTLGVTKIIDVSADFLSAQLDCVFSDIFPDSVKIGMVSNKDLVYTIADKLAEYNAKNIVVDPVMVATSGSSLIKNSAISALCERILPMATLVTPNIPEAEILAETKIELTTDMEYAAEKLNERFGCAVLLKGGHNFNDANDVLCDNGHCTWFYGERIHNPNTHGTGCTLSSAISANLAKGYPLFESIKKAKEYITGALSYGLNLGHGSGPLNHAFDLAGKFKD